MTAADARARIAAQARILDAADRPGALGPRARRLSRRLAERAGRAPAPPLAFADLLAAPDWASWPPERRETFLHLAGAVACAPVLRRTIDGRILARLARRIGEAALDAVLAIPSGLVPASACEAALGGDDGLRALGAAVLLSDVGERPALAARLARLLEAEPWPLAPSVGRAALHAARGCLTALELGREAEPAEAAA